MKYQFEWERAILDCTHCPCVDSERFPKVKCNLNKRGVAISELLKGYPDWCPLVEVQDE